MLSHCANSQCRTPFLRLQQGKLFLVETEYASQPSLSLELMAHRKRKPLRATERFWLCDCCAQVWTLLHDRSRGIVLLPLLIPAARATLRGEFKGVA